MNLLVYLHSQAKRRIVFLLVIVFLLLFYSKSSLAHNLWILGDANHNGDGAVHLYFEHHVGPGDGAYLGPIEERGKTWLRTPAGQAAPITLEAVREKGTKYLAGNTGKTTGPYAIDHTSLYGIYHGRLDFFHGRYIEATDTKSLAALSESPDLPVQIVPVVTEKGLLVRVLYFSTPQPGAGIWILEDDGAEESFTTNHKGELLIGPVDAGTHYISTRIIEKDPAGAFEYQAYKGIMHGSTLILKLKKGIGR